MDAGRQERLSRCRSNCRGGAAADHAFRTTKEQRSTRSAGAASRAQPLSRSTHGSDQSDPRLSSRARHYRATRTCGAAASAAFILAQPLERLSPLLLHLIGDLTDDRRRLDARIEDITTQIENLAKLDEDCRRLMGTPVVGPVIASAMVAARLRSSWQRRWR